MTECPECGREHDQGRHLCPFMNQNYDGEVTCFCCEDCTRKCQEDCREA